MNTKKYEIVPDMKMYWDGFTLHRIRACVDFITVSGQEVKQGDIGGWIEKEENLSQNGKAWIFDNAKVYCHAQVSEYAEVSENAMISGNAKIYGSCRISSAAEVFGDAEIFGNARVFGCAEISGRAKVYGYAELSGDVKVFRNAKIYGSASVTDFARVCDNAKVFDEAKIHGCAVVRNNAVVCKNAEVFGNAVVCGDTELFWNAKVSSIKHVVCISAIPIGKFADSLTMYRTKDNKINVSFSFNTYSIDEFQQLLNDYYDEKDQTNALAAVELGKKCIVLD